jgi:hypothetical protein
VQLLFVVHRTVLQPIFEPLVNAKVDPERWTGGSDLRASSTVNHVKAEVPSGFQFVFHSRLLSGLRPNSFPSTMEIIDTDNVNLTVLRRRLLWQRPPQLHNSTDNNELLDVQSLLRQLISQGLLKQSDVEWLVRFVDASLHIFVVRRAIACSSFQCHQRNEEGAGCMETE